MGSLVSQYQTLTDQIAQNDYQQQLLNYTPSVPTPRTTMPTITSGNPLTADRIQSWFSAPEVPKPVAPTPTAGGVSGGFTGGGTGVGLGLAAYGFKGNSGGAGTRGKGNKYGFQPKMWQALSAANAAMAKAGLGAFGVTDGWRSYASQVDLKKRKPTLAAPPGRSVHGIGYAADLKLTSKQLAWLKKNGSRFGLVNLPSESWHWQLDPRRA
jgi:hypothetical protein